MHGLTVIAPIMRKREGVVTERNGIVEILAARAPPIAVMGAVQVKAKTQEIARARGAVDAECKTCLQFPCGVKSRVVDGKDAEDVSPALHGEFHISVSLPVGGNEADVDALLAHDYEKLEQYFQSSLEFKKKFIEADEFDRGERILLNFAHTFGHAYETVSRYAVPHGSAVALGMMTANAISVRRGMIPQDYADRIAAVCRKILTHVEIKKEYFDLKAVVSAIRKDKKQTDRNITAVLINEKYELSVFRDVEEEEIAFAINHLLSSME